MLQNHKLVLIQKSNCIIGILGPNCKLASFPRSKECVRSILPTYHDPAIYGNYKISLSGASQNLSSIGVPVWRLIRCFERVVLVFLTYLHLG